MEIIIKDIAKLKPIIKTASLLIQEGKFIITNEGMFLQATDPSMVTFINFRLKPHAFEPYLFDQPQKFIVDILYFNSILERLSGKTKLEFNGDLVLTDENNKHYSIPLLTELHEENIESIASLDKFNSVIEISSKLLLDIINDISVVTKTEINLVATGGELLIKASEVRNSYKRLLKLDNFKNTLRALDFKILSNGNSDSTFNLEFLEKMVNPDLSDMLTLKLGMNYPLKIEAENEFISFYGIVAPRITE